MYVHVHVPTSSVKKVEAGLCRQMNSITTEAVRPRQHALVLVVRIIIVHIARGHETMPTSVSCAYIVHSARARDHAH